MVFSDHSAFVVFLSPEAKQDQRGPGVWKFNNSLLTDKDYTELISEKKYLSLHQNIMSEQIKGSSGK